MCCPTLLRALALLLVVHATGHAAARPNVLLLLVDDLKPSFGAYGDSWVHSPNLDRLAARGVRFDAAYCNQAVCAPSRNNLMTGMHSSTLGVYSLGQNFRKAAPDAVTLPQYFRRHGYHAAGIGKVYHVGHGNHDDAESWSVPFHPDKVVDYALPESNADGLTREEALFGNFRGDKSSLPRGAAWERADVDDMAYADGRIAAEGIERLRGYQESDEPFFLALGFVKPHLPFCAPEKYWALYDDVEFPAPEQREGPAGAPSYAMKTGLGEINQYDPVPKAPPIEGELERQLVHGYYASLSYMDAQVGRVLDELDELGLSENTIVVLWGDHGWHLGDHGFWTKHTNYEQANRIPLVFAGPGIEPGATGALAETVDVYPTLAELAGLPAPAVPQPIDGVSQADVIGGGSTGVRDHAFHTFPRGGRLGRAVRTDRYRLVEWKRFGAPDATAEYELYDYAADPLERENLAASESALVNELRKLLDRHPAPTPPIKNRRTARRERAASL